MIGSVLHILCFVKKLQLFQRVNTEEYFSNAKYDHEKSFIQLLRESNSEEEKKKQVKMAIYGRFFIRKPKQLKGLQLKFDKYDLFLWTSDHQCVWIFIIPFIYDSTLFVMQFLHQDNMNPIVRMAIILEFFLFCSFVIALLLRIKNTRTFNEKQKKLIRTREDVK